jgi:Uma2 family endonuclease
MALIYPDQGSWTVDEYLELDIGRHVEFSDGHLEFLPMPTELHQNIVLWLVNALRSYAAEHGGTALMAPLPVRLWSRKFREPDVVFMRPEHMDRRQGTHWEGADLAIEVISETNRRLDAEVKRGEYARAGIPEYWLVDPQREEITVLVLRDDTYIVQAVHQRGDRAASTVLPGFVVEVTAVLGAH